MRAQGVRNEPRGPTKGNHKGLCIQVRSLMPIMFLLSSPFAERDTLISQHLHPVGETWQSLFVCFPSETSQEKVPTRRPRNQQVGARGAEGRTDIPPVFLAPRRIDQVLHEHVRGVLRAAAARLLVRSGTRGLWSQPGWRC